MEVLLKNHTLNETYLETWHAKSKLWLSDMARVNSRLTGGAGSNIMQYFASHFVLCLIYPIFAKDKLDALHHWWRVLIQTIEIPNTAEDDLCT